MRKGWDQTSPGGRYSERERGSGCWQTLLILKSPCPAFAEDGLCQPALAPGPQPRASGRAANAGLGLRTQLLGLLPACGARAVFVHLLPGFSRRCPGPYFPKQSCLVGRKNAC